MMILLRYIALPILIVGATLFAIKVAWGYSPIAVISTFGVIFVAITVKGYSIRRNDLQRGWRVGHAGRDQMFYEEMIAGRWERIEIDGEMQCGDGDTHHVVWLSTTEKWRTLPKTALGHPLS